MRRPPETLNEAYESKLAHGRRADLQTRVLTIAGGSVVALVGVVLASAVCARFVPMGESDLAAGNGGRAVLHRWKEAPVAFSKTLPGGPMVEARATLPATGSSTGVEFRVDGKTVATVVGGVGPVDLRGTQVSFGKEREIVVALPAGYRELRPPANAGRWQIEFRTAQ